MGQKAPDPESLTLLTGPKLENVRNSEDDIFCVKKCRHL
jgi:hypothetical protein